MSKEQQQKPIPRVSRWVARENVNWTHRSIPGGSHYYEKGTKITVVVSDHEQPHRFDYARGLWYPEGMTVVDPCVDRALPRQFEPLAESFEVLVDPRHLNYARADVPYGLKKIKIKSEVDDVRAKIDEMPAPEPLDPDALVKGPDEEQHFNPTDPSARPGMVI